MHGDCCDLCIQISLYVIHTKFNERCNSVIARSLVLNYTLLHKVGVGSMYDDTKAKKFLRMAQLDEFYTILHRYSKPQPQMKYQPVLPPCQVIIYCMVIDQSDCNTPPSQILQCH